MRIPRHNKPVLFLFALAGLILATTAGAAARPNTGNDYFAGGPSSRLAGPEEIEILGEIEKPGSIPLERFPRRVVETREATLRDGERAFVGAYRYEGVSLFDLLRDRIVKKSHPDGFRPAVDLLVAVENRRGERVVVSWGELFYAAIPHRILIATGASSVVPMKTQEPFDLPHTTRLVCADDRLAFRMIERPCRVVVFSAPVSVEQRRGVDAPSPELRIVAGMAERGFTLRRLPAAATLRRVPTVFYGHGMGFHDFRDFRGMPLGEACPGALPADPLSLARGYAVVCAIDGYRAAFSLAELLNRADAREPLLCEYPAADRGGRFKIHPPADFFADRTVRSITAIRLFRLP